MTATARGIVCLKPGTPFQAIVNLLDPHARDVNTVWVSDWCDMLRLMDPTTLSYEVRSPDYVGFLNRLDPFAAKGWANEIDGHVGFFGPDPRAAAREYWRDQLAHAQAELLNVL